MRDLFKEVDHSHEELYVYDQCCKNCRYFDYEVCNRPGVDEYDAPSADGSDWCEYWKNGTNGRWCW